MFAGIKAAGLSPAEFAVLVGVKRVAVYNWIAGRSSPHMLIEPRVKKTLVTIKKLVEMGRLPLAEGIDKETRKAKLQKIKEVLDALQPRA